MTRGSQRLSFAFDRDIAASLGTDDLILQNVSTGQTIPASELSLSYAAATNTATFIHSGVLPDGNHRATILASGVGTPQGAPLAADYSLNFFFLNGDANHDRHVDVPDLVIFATNWQASGKTFGDGDFNYDGSVDAADLGILAASWQKVLPVSVMQRATAPLRLPMSRSIALQTDLRDDTLEPAAAMLTV